VSHKYADGQLTAEEAYPTVFKTVVALLVLERIQFMASFAITFTICSTNLFQPIGKAVQKIAQDELEVHVDLDKEVLRIELATERGQKTYQELKAFIKRLIDEVVQGELDWTDYLFSEGRELLGTNAQKVKNWVLFNARDVYDFLDIESDHKFPKTNPMAHLEDWISIGKTQAAPQEQDNNQYKVNVIVRDDESTEFEVDF
jgi:ribonucleoside-diphosphate reductase beta chain